MAEIREVLITIKGGKGATSDTPQTQAKEMASKTEAPLTSVLLTQAYQSIKQEISAEVGYQIDKYLTLNDDYMMQRDANMIKSAVGKAVGIGASALAVLSMGGGPVGVALAVSLKGINLANEVRRNYEREGINLNISTNQLSFSRARAGYSLTSGSIGEER